VRLWVINEVFSPPRTTHKPSVGDLWHLVESAQFTALLLTHVTGYYKLSNLEKSKFATNARQFAQKVMETKPVQVRVHPLGR